MYAKDKDVILDPLVEPGERTINPIARFVLG